MQTHQNINVSDFKLIRVIGNGKSEKVILIQNNVTKEYYAMKVLYKKHIIDKNFQINEYNKENTNKII